MAAELWVTKDQNLGQIKSASSISTMINVPQFLPIPLNLANTASKMVHLDVDVREMPLVALFTTIAAMGAPLFATISASVNLLTKNNTMMTCTALNLFPNEKR